MSSPGKRQTSVSHKGALTRQKSGEGDPWCLTCGVNLRVDGGTFSVLSKHNNGDLCDIFSRVLGAELSEGYASINMCNRCERQLRRLGRYNSIILARNEGKKLRDQLEKNLAKYGQKVVESGDIHDLDASGVSQAGSNVAANSPGYSPKKGKISEGSVGRTRSAVASRPSSTGSVPASKSIDISGASHTVRNGSGVGARRSSGPGPLLEKKKPSSPFEEVEKRLEARRRKWSNASSTSEDSLTNTATEDPKVPADTKAGGTTSHQHRSVSFQDQVVSKDGSVNQTPQLTSSVLSEETGDDADEMETDDKKTLVERSESLDQDYRRDVYKKKGKFTFGFRSAADGGSKASKRVASPTNDEPPQASVEGVHTSPAETASPVHWSGRINPFDVEAEKGKAAGSFEFASSLDDDVFMKGIIDLDDVSSTKHKHDDASVGRGSVQTMDSERIRRDLMTDLDSKTFKDFSRASSTSLDDTEPEVDPSDYNADNRSSLSEVEERINIKTQFKGAYYNIGSTEDLLQDLENELAAERAKASKLTPINSIDKEDGHAQTKLPRLVKPAEAVSRGSAEGQQKRKENNGQDYTPLIDTKDEETSRGDKISDQGPHDVTEVETSFNGEVGKESIVDDVNVAEVVDDLVVTPRQELQPVDVEVAEVATVSKSNAVIIETTLEKSIQDEIDEQPEEQPDEQHEEQPEVYDGDDEKTDGRDQLEDMQNLPSEGAPLTKKSEKSPLISSDLKVKGGKDGKFSDHQPGFLCCTIL
ncbi:unnamed protein product [Lymnaea stagnalis]|uniref:ZAD domain-containing protein n=1 Tax=Lymnaea stagnalis TaxID=6523 RepID=A0AAV2IQ10_LYMST